MYVESVSKSTKYNNSQVIDSLSENILLELHIIPVNAADAVIILHLFEVDLNFVNVLFEMTMLANLALFVSNFSKV